MTHFKIERRKQIEGKELRTLMLSQWHRPLANHSDIDCEHNLRTLGSY